VGTIWLATRWEKAVRDCPTLSRRAKATAYALRTYMDRDGLCWPSLSRLELATGSSVATVTRALNDLDEAGFVIRDRSRGGVKHSTRYRARIPEPLQSAIDSTRTVAGSRGNSFTVSDQTVSEGETNYPLELPKKKELAAEEEPGTPWGKEGLSPSDWLKKNQEQGDEGKEARAQAEALASYAVKDVM